MSAAAGSSGRTGGHGAPPRDLAYYVEGLVEGTRGTRGTLVQRQKDRSVWNVKEGGKSWFAKHGITSKRRREIRREVTNAAALEAAGLGASVLASGGDATGEWIVTEWAGASLRLAFSSKTRHQALLEVAEFIRRFHAAGFATPDLVADHIRWTPGRTLMIDAARLERGEKRVSLRRRARDLAALAFSLATSGLDLVTRTELVRLVRTASDASESELARVFEFIERETSRLRDRTRWRHAHWEVSSEFDATLSPQFDGPDDWPGDAFYWVRNYMPPVYGALLVKGDGTDLVRTLPDRENRTLGRDADGRPLFFLKVFPATPKGWSPAMREVAAIDLFQRAGILVNRLAAYAEDVDKGSMVAVKAARGEPLDDLLRRGVTVAERRALAVQTARIWRRMRECGLRHRDAYPCHLFAARWEAPGFRGPVRPFGVPPSGGTTRPSPVTVTNAVIDRSVPPEGGTPNRFELRLIDMTRAGKAPFPKERWFIKDAAALWHGLPKPPVTRTDAVRWLREYFRIDRLDARAKRFARRVAAKEARIAARQARKKRK